jgi:predicted alpha/beta hydrolase
MHSTEPFSLVTPDGQTLAATRYWVDAQQPKAVVVIAGATAVPQQFYRRFAESLAARGMVALSFDYRGVGGSAPKSLVGYKMDYLDWARVDLATVIRAVARPDLPLLMVGHSYGGHALGLLPPQCQVDGLYTFGTGAGWHGWMPARERLRVRAMWGFIGPILTAWKGYLPFKLLGMGEDLPLDVYRQWRRWCQFPRYFFDDPLIQAQLEGFARVTTPIVAANSIDDAWAVPRSRDAFMAGYTRATVESRDLVPADYGLRNIGHMGYFRAESRQIWEHVHAWADARIAAFTPTSSTP